FFSTGGPSSYYPAGGSIEGDVLVAGGLDPTNGAHPPTADVFDFDPVRIQWTPVAPLSVARHGMLATELPRFQGGNEALAFSGGLVVTDVRSDAVDVYRSPTGSPTSTHLFQKTDDQ